MARFGLTIACVALLAHLAGCTREEGGDLLDLARIEPVTLEPDMPLTVVGEGFRAGHAGSVRLDGEIARPGENPAPFSTTLAAHAVSSERMVVDAPDLAPLHRASGVRGTFHGTLVAEIETGSDGHHLRGRLRDVMLSTDDIEGPEHDRLLAQGQTILVTMGLVAEPTLDDRGGLDVTRVEPGGRAAAAGLRAGDRIVASDSRAVADVGDLVGAPNVESVVLTIAGTEGDRTVRLEGLGKRSDRALGVTPWTHGWIVVLLLAMLTALAARAGAFRGLSAAASFEHRPSTLNAMRMHAAAAFAAFALWGLMVCGAKLHAIALLATVILSQPAFWRAGPATSFATRKTHPLLDGLLGALPVSACALVVLLGAGRLDIDALLERQGVAPWTWNVFTEPALYLITPWLLLPRPNERVHGQAISRVHHVALVLFITTLCFGGWAGGGAVGCSLFVGKAAALSWLRSVVARREDERYEGLRAITAIGALVLTYARQVRGLPLEPLTGYVLFAAVAVALIFVRWRKTAPQLVSQISPLI